MSKISRISFPNTVADSEQQLYCVGENGVDSIKRITKNGETASVGWFSIEKDGVVLAEIKESVCNVYY